MSEDNRPVLIVMDENYLVHAGDPTTIGNDLIIEYVMKGLTLRTITIQQYRDKKWTWIYEKEKTVSSEY